MATGAQTWSTTAASNNSIDTSVNWAEGMAPSAVNNSARAEMASAAMWIGDNSGVLVTSGTSAAYTVTSKQVSTGLVDGYTIAVRLHSANDASATLNVDAVGAKQIQRYAGTNVSASEFTANSVHRFTYNSGSTAWVAHGQRDITTIPSSFTVTGATLLTGAATLSSSLTVANATLLSSNLTVSGTATITGKVTASSSMEVTGATLFSSGITAASIAGSVVATQADQETGTSVATIVTPGRQKYNPCAAKAWARITWSAGVPALTEGYNISATVTDVNTGKVTVAFTNALSSATYAVVATVLYGSADN